jgi:biotin transport system substrate-specific component
MDITLSYAKRLYALGACLFGCGLIAVCSLIKIPFFPVPFTMQTFALFLIGLTQTPKQALSSTLTYLFCATIGLPVLGGLSNPLWYLGKSGGYLIAFPLAAWLIAKIAEKRPPWLAVSAGQLAILLIGFPWLIPFVGLKIAFTHGVLIFIGPSILKGASAIYLASKWSGE